MKILFIEPSGAGGIAHYTYCLVKALGELGVHCNVITANRWQYFDVPECVNVYPVFNRLRTNPIRLFRLCYQLSHKSDIVHWQSASHPQLLYVLSRLIPVKRIPWIYTVHNVLSHENAEKSKPVYQKIYQRMDGLILHSQHSLSEFDRIFPEIKVKKMIIPHGEYGFFLPSKKPLQSALNQSKLLFFGNIRPYKGLDTLLKAIAIIKKEIQNVELSITGQLHGSFDEYQQLIEQLNIQSNVVTRLEYIKDEEIPEVFQHASIVVLPYKIIDQSGVLLLAMAFGKAVIATRVGGLPEVIQDQKSGVLIAPDDELQLADAAIELLKDHEKMKTLGENAYHDVKQKFSWKSIAETTLNYYKLIISP